MTSTRKLVAPDWGRIPTKRRGAAVDAAVEGRARAEVVALA